MKSHLEPAETSHVVQKDTTLITSCLLEAFLACHFKCNLLSKGEIPAGSDYTNWLTTQMESYRSEGIHKVTAEHPHELDSSALDLVHWKNASWRFALKQVVQTQEWETLIQVVQRITPEAPNSSTQLVPFRFVPTRKLSNAVKMMAAFDALILAKSLDTKIGMAKIVHGEKCSVSTVKVNLLARAIYKIISQISALLTSSAPPDLILNRHCPECEFQDRCRKQAVEKDDLSLLANLPDKDRVRLKSKGIFTVTQLSYTFRPRRRLKRLAGQPEKYHHELKALAIRERKIHVVGTTELRLDGTVIFFDVEGLPDRDFYYLIGVRVENKNGVEHYSFWADTASDEKRIWQDFLNLISGIESPFLMHYGSYETTFLKRMYDRYGGPPKDSSANKAMTSSVNLLSIIYARVYFPTYSNGLKEIARFLGFEWGDPLASGLQSVAWRSQWEESGDVILRKKLIAYNTDDCDALSLVAHTLKQLLVADIAQNNTLGGQHEIVHEETLGKNINSKWRAFKSPIVEMELINDAAYWIYQRDRVFVRSGVPKRNLREPPKRTSWCSKKAETTHVIKAPTSCPECGKRGRKKFRFLSRTVQDLVFGRDSVKRRVVQYVIQTYICRSCGHEYRLDEWRLHGQKWGWNMVAYFVYHIVGLRIPQRTMQHSMNQLFSLDLAHSTLNEFKIKAANYYLLTKEKILERIVHGTLIHADETRANIQGHLAYVWVLTNMKEVVYILAESREAEIVRTLLKDFKGVLVSDFYAAYDAINCTQQKCLIHLMRDLNDEILHNPFDHEIKSIAIGFSDLLKPIVDTIDRHGLKKRSLRKHIVEVEDFFKFLDFTNFSSEAALKCKQRFEKNKDTLFTFLSYDGVPWNNNNAEHAIKAFARLRDVISGTSTKKGVDEYLTLLSVAETCEYQGLNFLSFLRSGETDIESFAKGHRKYIRRKKVGGTPIPAP